MTRPRPSLDRSVAGGRWLPALTDLQQEGSASSSRSTVQSSVSRYKGSLIDEFADPVELAGRLVWCQMNLAVALNAGVSELRWRRWRRRRGSGPGGVANPARNRDASSMSSFSAPVSAWACSSWRRSSSERSRMRLLRGGFPRACGCRRGPSTARSQALAPPRPSASAWCQLPERSAQAARLRALRRPHHLART